MADIDRELHNPGVRFEPSDVMVKPAYEIGIGIYVIVLAIAGLVVFLFSFLMYQRTGRVVAPKREFAMPPAPRLQVSPRTDFRQYYAQQMELLNGYHWVDRDAGLVHIPITQAMHALADRGIPPQKAPPGLVLTNPQEGSRLTGFEGRFPEEVPR
jgi:hypothetical protein